MCWVWFAYWDHFCLSLMNFSNLKLESNIPNIQILTLDNKLTLMRNRIKIPVGNLYQMFNGTYYFKRLAVPVSYVKKELFWCLPLSWISHDFSFPTAHFHNPNIAVKGCASRRGVFPTLHGTPAHSKSAAETAREEEDARREMLDSQRRKKQNDRMKEFFERKLAASPEKVNAVFEWERTRERDEGRNL